MGKWCIDLARDLVIHTLWANSLGTCIFRPGSFGAVKNRVFSGAFLKNRAENIEPSSANGVICGEMRGVV